MATGTPCEGERKGVINSELWHACAGPLVTLPPVGSLVVYFPQGHSEQVATSMQTNVDAQIPNYPNLPSKLICMLHNVTLHADSETDEVYAQMTLQPINVSNKEALFASDPALIQNRPHTEFFCKTLTASDTSTHGGFSVPRRAAEKIFPPLDFSMQPPVQELQARDLHGTMWTFRHIYRGQPKRHLLTTGWSLFVSGKRLVAGDSVLFIRDEKSQLLLGIRRANKQPNNISSSVLSSDSMHIGILAAAAHADANNSPFTVFYNPRASPSEFVIPLAKYNKAIYSNHISLGMRFRMMFETEESGTRRYMGTITGISDLDPLRWKDSKWRNIQVGWDESAASERRNRVSVWEIEPVIAPFFICPPPFLGSKLPRQFGGDSSDMENIFKRFRPWVGEESQSHMPGLSLAQWMSMQQNHLLVNSNAQQNNLVAASNMRPETPDYICSLTGPALQNLGATNLTNQSGLQQQVLQQNNVQINAQNPIQQMQQLNQMAKLSVPLNQFGTTQQQPSDSMQQRQNLINQACPSSQTNNFLQPQVLMPTQFQQQHLAQNIQPPQAILPLNSLKQFPVQQQHLQQEQNQMPIHMYRQMNHPTQILDQEIQIQLLQKLQQQQNSSMLQLPASQAIQQQQNLLKASQNFTQTLSQQNFRSQQISRITSIEDHLSQSLQHQAHQKCQQQRVTEATLPGVILQATSLLSPNRNCVPTTGVAKEETTDDVPPCSISLPIISNGAICSQTIKDSTFPGPIAPDEIPHSAVTTLSSRIPEVPSIAPDINKDLYIKDNKVKHQVYLGSLPQVDFLDSSSSANSDSLPQADGQLQQSLPLSSFKQQTLFPRSSIPESNTQGADPVHDDLLCINIDGTGTFDIPSRSACLAVKEINPGNDFLNHLSSGNTLTTSRSKEAQQDISSCYVSRSFGVPDVAFSSVHPTTSDSNYLNRSSRTPASQPQKIRTYTKVYKRGAVGRSIDVTRYSGYTELKQDLARMFSIGGQLEDLQRMGWKLVYVDQENDVLLVGDDPWEEFVSCVRCIRILSPQEVQQMSLDGDIDNSILPNPACSSSDGRNVWSEEGYQNPMNPSTLSYGHFG